MFLTFLCSTFFAHLSDMVGRRPCLILAFAANLLPSAAFLYWAVSDGSIYTYYLIKGLTYGIFNSASICYAVVGDRTHKQNRARCFGMIMIMWRFGDTIAPLGAMLAISTDAVLSFIMLAGALCIVLKFVPESLDQADVKPFTWSVFKNPFKPQMMVFQSRVWWYFLMAFAWHSGPDGSITIAQNFFFQAFFGLTSVGLGSFSSRFVLICSHLLLMFA